jgi:hypothetical protein
MRLLQAVHNMILQWGIFVRRVFCVLVCPNVLPVTLIDGFRLHLGVTGEFSCASSSSMALRPVFFPCPPQSPSFSESSVQVSRPIQVLQGGVVNPTPNLQPGGPGCPFCLGHHLWPVRHGPASSYAPADVALKPRHYVTVGTPSARLAVWHLVPHMDPKYKFLAVLTNGTLWRDLYRNKSWITLRSTDSIWNNFFSVR